MFPFLYLRSILPKADFYHSFCTKDPRANTFPKAHSKDIEQFLGKWGKWVSKNGIIN
jgi:hypothetical protein